MAKLPRHTIDEIRERTDLVSLVERHVKLKQRGNSHVGLCPFHQEKTPSFHVVPRKDLYHCFGCGAAGDCFKFLMEIEGLSFIEAVRELASSAGVTLEERELTPQERRHLEQRASRFEALDKASRFWEAILHTRPEGSEARAYLRDRGIDQDTARTWRLGVAPQGWTTTIDRLQREGLSPQLLLDAGIARKSQRGDRIYDAFRERITIPITDERGRIIAFGARLLQGDGPKYINSAEGPTYQKSKILFGMHQARQPIQREGHALLVEGYFDVISLHQAGFPQAVATCGTSLTDDHLESLRRLTDDLIALFDSDEAGARAAERALPLCFSAGIEPWRLELPAAKDPDELIREEGPEAMKRALAARRPLLDWVIERRITANGGRAAGESLTEEIVELLALTEGVDIVGRAAARLKVHVPVLQARVDQARLRRQRSRGSSAPQTDPPDLDEAPPEPPPWKPTRDHVHLLWLLVHHQASVHALALRLGLASWPELEEAAPLVSALLQGTPVATLVDESPSDLQRRMLVQIAARQGLYTEVQAPRALVHIAHRMVEARLEHTIRSLSETIRDAVLRHEWQTQQAATRQQVALRNLRNQLTRAFRADEPEPWAKIAVEALQATSPAPTEPEYYDNS
ncbi:MAG: DNA primase [Deltaproteobacteria bacterium]|nr:MAG: DNA primase [Deltaproteobacteria bacterium]